MRLVLLTIVLMNGCSSDDVASADLSAQSDLPLRDLSATSDATHQVDLSRADFGGTQCGSAGICSANEGCCGQSSAPPHCGSASSCDVDAFIFWMCDGPEDCAGSAPNCCTGLVSSMSSYRPTPTCTTTCAATRNPGGGTSPGSLQTKLCHTAADCAGYSGEVLSTTEPFDHCCSEFGPLFRYCRPLSDTAGRTCD